jgi:hypothetical protein
VKGQVQCTTLEHSENRWIFRLTGQFALPRYHLPMTRECNFINVPIWIILGKIGFECISAQAEGFLKAVGRKPSGEGSSVVFQARTLSQPLDI